MADLTPFIIKQNDTRPNLVAVLQDGVGTGASPIDLTTAKAVRFIMRGKNKKDNDGPKTKRECDITDPSKGVVTYVWMAADTDTVSEFNGEFEIEWEDGGIETVPNNGYFAINIVDDLG